MANIKSQIKRNRQNSKRQLRNKTVRSEMRTRAKNALEAARTGDATAAQEALRLAQKQFDVASTRNVIHRNTAARRKSSLARQVNELLGSGSCLTRPTG